MQPKFDDNDFVLASAIPFLIKEPRIGDIIFFRKEGKFILKRITEIKDGKYKVTGDNKNDSQDFGNISRPEIIGKIIHKL